jgi:uncharacterized protein (DUF488 family)
MAGRVYTIGHSNLETGRLVDLLRANGVDTVVDVRSQPFSKLYPRFNRRELGEALRLEHIRYSFMGDSLGGRPAAREFYDDDGHVSYARWARSGDFQDGLRRLRSAATRYTVALLCSEEDPSHCHRHLLIARELAFQGWPPSDILHIRGDGRVVPSGELGQQASLLGESGWRSPQSVLHKVRPSTSSAV